MKAQARNSFPAWASLSSPDILFRQVVSSNRRSYSQFNIRGLAASSWRGPHAGPPRHRPSMSAALASHLVATAGCAHLQHGRVYSRACRMHRCSKIESGIASNDQSIWKRSRGMIVMGCCRFLYASVPSLMRPSAHIQQASSRAVATLATTGRLRRSREKCSRRSTRRFTPEAAWFEIDAGTVSS